MGCVGRAIYDGIRGEQIWSSRHQTHGGNSVNSQPVLKFCSLSDSPANLQQSVS